MRTLTRLVLGIASVVVLAASSSSTATAKPSTATAGTEPAVEWPAGGWMPNYPNERAADQGSPKVGCGSVEYSLTQEKRLNGTWGAYASSVVPNSGKAAPCTFPHQGGKWASLQTQAKKQAAAWSNAEAGDAVIVPNDSRWEAMTSSDGGVLRGIRFLLFRKSLQLGMEKTKCGEADAAIVCEASGSKAVLALNQIRWRLAVAKEALPKKNLEGCKDYAKWAVGWSRGVPKFRAELKASKSWTENLTYKTRYDGNLGEEQLLARVAAVGAEAEKTFKACGGTDLKIADYDEVSFKGF